MSVVRAGDRVFSGLSRSAGIVILLILASVAIFLTVEALPGLTASEGDVHALGDRGFWGYAWPLVFGTLWAAAIALVIATPLAIALALFITLYTPKRIGGPIGYMVDLLAAVPSVVFGLWGIAFLAPNLVPVYAWLSVHLGYVPFFATAGDHEMTTLGRIILIAGVLVVGTVALLIVLTAGKRHGGKAGRIIALLAGIPGAFIVLWGISILSGGAFPFNTWVSNGYTWLAERVPFVPTVDSGAVYSLSTTGRTIMTAAIVLAIMILPIITAICREIFLQTPRLHIEAALALGATRWEMIRMAVFPYARSGIVGATMLGLGRALGETMAVAMVLSASGVVSFRLLTSTNPSTIPANIAQGYPEATGLTVNVLIATGLVLFVITFAVNFVARWIVSRRAEFSGAN